MVVVLTNRQAGKSAVHLFVGVLHLRPVAEALCRDEFDAEGHCVLLRLVAALMGLKKGKGRKDENEGKGQVG